MFAVIVVATAAAMSVEAPVSPVVLHSSSARTALWIEPVPRNNFTLDLTGNPGQPQVQLNYHVPLSGKGFLGFGGRLWEGLTHPFQSLKELGNEAGETTLSVYGLKVHPKNLVVTEVPQASTAAAAAASASSSTQGRRRLALEPILFDIEDQLKADALYRGLEMAAPQTRSLNRSQQTYLLNDMLILHREHETTLFEIPAEGVDFLMKPSSSTR